MNLTRGGLVAGLASLAPMASAVATRARAMIGYTLFFMNEGALGYLDQSLGIVIGVGPSVIDIDEGATRKLTSSTLTQDVCACIVSAHRGNRKGKS